ncbi:uncharacterized protein LOC120092830 [Benincasa hispida]|uniref:uncharacterized protein LOC120092830 n=1 Tax=Benincasa hispida TaxID=102211 RepID=UPI0019001A80|nr:uncharacterized protein LOC120092830 [Benincasa hispida]
MDGFALLEERNRRKMESKYHEVVGKEVDMSGEDDKSIIPQFFALQNINPKSPQPKTAPYLRYVPNDDKFEGLLHFSGKNVLSPFSKFESEVSENDPKLFHIKCCYNNKYWVRRSDESDYILATATKKEEDKSKWTCTLFEPIYDSDNKAFRFIHVQENLELFRAGHYDYYQDALLAKESPATLFVREDGVFTTVIDWSSLFIFPKHVTFKGYNGKYLKFFGNFLQFSGTDLEHPSLIHEIFPQNDGTVRIKNVGSRKFWIRDTNWILATAGEGSSEDPNTFFQPVKLGDNIVALRNLGNNHFCTSLSVDRKTDCLNANDSNPTKEARMEVSEAVISSKIENIEYRLEDAKIYGERVWSMAKGDAINKTKAADTLQFTFSFEDKRKKNWTNTIATKFGVTREFTAGVPLIGDAKVQLKFEVGGSYSWGETHKDKILMTCSSTITVPPMSKVKIDVVVKRGFCNVPYSYTRTDTLRDGQQTTHEYEDGVFSGVNSYQFQIRTDKVALPV